MITLKRTYFDDKTTGEIMLPEGYVIQTLELPWRDNKVGKSCIPEGQYIISRDHTGRHKWFKVNDVEGRTFIEIHQASHVSQLEGCIGIRRINDLEKLVMLFEEHDWVLKIC